MRSKHQQGGENAPKSHIFFLCFKRIESSASILIADPYWVTRSARNLRPCRKSRSVIIHPGYLTAIIVSAISFLKRSPSKGIQLPHRARVSVKFLKIVYRQPPWTKTSHFHRPWGESRDRLRLPLPLRNCRVVALAAKRVFGRRDPNRR